MSIRTRVVWIIVFMAVVIIVLGLGTGWVFTAKSFNTIVESDMATVADTADRLISSEINLLYAKADIIASRILDMQDGEIQDILIRELHKHPEFLSLSVAEAGEVTERAGFPVLQSELLGEDFVVQALAGKRMISTSIHDSTSGQLVFYVCAPIPRGTPADPPRVLAAAIDGLFFADVLEGIQVWKSGHIFIDDAEGYILANPRKNWVLNRHNFILLSQTDSQYERIATVIRKMLQGGRGMDTFSLFGIERFCSYRPVTASGSGWTLGVIAPVNESPIPNSRIALLIVCAVCLILSFVAAIAASRIIETPYRTISDMVSTLEYKDKLLMTVNDTAGILMGGSSASFEKELQSAMAMLAKCIDADRLRIWQVRREDDKFTCARIYEWLGPNAASQANPRNVSGKGLFSCWEEKLLAGTCISGSLGNFSEEEQKILSSMGIRSLVAVPLALNNSFWGFITYEDCSAEREFSPLEENLLLSGGLMVASSIQRNRIMLDLIKAREEAVVNAEAKSAFLANMSHEMRTPLNAIIGLSELSLGSRHIQSEDYDNLNKIYNSGVTLLGLINDILDLSKIESGKFEIIPVIYDTPSLINDIITLNSVHIGSKPIEFFLEVDETLPTQFKGDDLRIKQMFNNLLSNAFKYTQKGRVEWKISWEKEGDDVWLVSSVKDTGVGIREEDLKKLFADYNQVDTKSNRKIRGTGLGLSITRRLAEMMDGGVAVESEYGKGSVFSVRVRQEPTSGAPIGRETVEKLQNFQYAERRRDRSAKLIRAYIPYARVLVVDDVATNLDVARGLMKPYGMQVDCVTSGSEAVEFVRRGAIKHNAIFMDHMMPGLDGIEATRLIRSINTEYAKTVPIIALTANAVVGNEEMFMRSGFQAFLSKPIDINALDTAINRWVRDKALEKAINPEAYGSTIEMSAQGDPADFNPEILYNSAVPGLNVEKGLEYLDGDLESYWNILESYAKNTPTLLASLPKALEEDPADYGRIVHGIKSSSRTLGAEALGDQAEALEAAVKEGRFDFVKERHAGFVADAEALIQGISALIQEALGDRAKPAKSEPDQTLLDELLAACKTFDIDETDRIMEELESYSYETGEDLVIWLREQLDVMGFKRIEERLAQSARGE